MPEGANEICNDLIRLRGGSLYLSCETYEKYFHGLDTVILLRREGLVSILPVLHMASGGYFLKLRNSRGDHVIDAPDFFREQGFDERSNILFEANWRANLSGLILTAQV